MGAAGLIALGKAAGGGGAGEQGGEAGAEGGIVVGLVGWGDHVIRSVGACALGEVAVP